MATKLICFVVSDINKALAFEWISRFLPEKGYSLCFILLNSNYSDLEDYLYANKIEVERITLRGKRDWLIALRRVIISLLRRKPNIVHCHLLPAGIIGLTAARIAGIRHRIYTRHHSSQHHIYNRRGIWLDYYCNQMATRIVAVSELVQRILTKWENVPLQKVSMIPHGFCLDIFSQLNADDLQSFQNRYHLGEKRPVIGVISRFIELKGVQYVLPAFRKYLEKYPDALLLLLNARGDYEPAIREELEKIPVSSYCRILFEPNISAAYWAMDIFIHVPIDDHSEAFGQIYVEALAAGVPSIFTLSGIAPDFVRDGENALVVPYRDSEAIYSAMIRLWENPTLRLHLINNGLPSVKERFDLPIMVNGLDKLYKECQNHS
jgi:glycosyltransferase involved in cell wall biosynthesis